MNDTPKPYEGASLERLSFSDLTALILAASGPALDAIEQFVADTQAANELAPDALAPEAVRFALSRLTNLRGSIAYRRLELAARRIEDEAGRLASIAEDHRARMLRELGDADPKLQRGNASAYSFVDGTIHGLTHALREIGFGDVANRIDYEREYVGRMGARRAEVAGGRP